MRVVVTIGLVFDVAGIELRQRGRMEPRLEKETDVLGHDERYSLLGASLVKIEGTHVRLCAKVTIPMIGACIGLHVVT